MDELVKTRPSSRKAGSTGRKQTLMTLIMCAAFFFLVVVFSEQQNLPETQNQPATRVAVLIPAVFDLVQLSNSLKALLFQTRSLRGLEVQVLIIETESFKFHSTSRASIQELLRTLPPTRFSIQFLLNSKGDLLLSQALNYGAFSSSFDFFVTLQPSIELHSDFLSKAIAYLQNDESVGVVGAKILNSDQSLHHCGISFGLYGAKNQRRWNEKPQKGDRLNIPLPYFPLQGYSALDKRANTQKDVLAVSDEAMVVRAEVFHAVGGFNATLANGLYSADFCLRVLRLGKRVVYHPELTATYHPPADSSRDSTVSHRWKDEEVRAFDSVWGAQLDDRIQTRFEVEDPIIYNMECGGGMVMGLTTEAVNLLTALEHKAFVIMQTSDFYACIRDVTASFPAAVPELLRRLHGRELHGDERVVLILHRDPGRYTSTLRSAVRGHKGVVYTVGRSMYETSSIPPHWSEPANNKVNEIWVPSTFNIKTFQNGGVRNRIFAVPEGVDYNMFDPISSPALHIPIERAKEFRFLSVFKFEPRKGWDILLDAYFSEFSSKDPVHLYIRTRMDDNQKSEFETFLAYYSERDDLPAVTIIDAVLPALQLPCLYAAMDAFVLPTRGEGWGLPVMEAMSMGLPTISTDWSGTTDFVTNDAAFPLKVEKLVDVPGGNKDTIGHKWALPSVSHLQTLMRDLYEDPSTARRRGEAARRLISTKFSQEAAANAVIARVLDIDWKLARVFGEPKLADPISLWDNEDENFDEDSGFGRGLLEADYPYWSSFRNAQVPKRAEIVIPNPPYDTESARETILNPKFTPNYISNLIPKASPFVPFAPSPPSPVDEGSVDVWANVPEHGTHSVRSDGHDYYQRLTHGEYNHNAHYELRQANNGGVGDSEHHQHHQHDDDEDVKKQQQQQQQQQQHHQDSQGSHHQGNDESSEYWLEKRSGGGGGGGGQHDEHEHHQHRARDEEEDSDDEDRRR